MDEPQQAEDAARDEAWRAICLAEATGEDSVIELAEAALNTYQNAVAANATAEANASRLWWRARWDENETALTESRARIEVLERLLREGCIITGPINDRIIELTKNDAVWEIGGPSILHALAGWWLCVRDVLAPEPRS